MAAVTIQLPASVSEADARLLLALKLYEVGRLSSGQAAELAGCAKRTFLVLLAQQGLAVFDHSADEAAGDLHHA